MLKKDSLRLGLLLGFFAPLIGLLAYYFAKFSMFTFKEFIGVILAQKTLLSAMVSVSLVASAAVFTYYVNTRKDRTAKGIFISTCIYAIVALLWRFFS